MLKIAHIIKHVMSFATEAEVTAVYIVAREAVYGQIVFKEGTNNHPLYFKQIIQWQRQS